MQQVKYVANLLLVILVIIFFSFLYFGITNQKPTSLDYNVPLARSILSGDFFHVSSNNPFMYFPGSSHVILALVLLLGLPNLFGLLGFVFLFFVCKKLGNTFNLKNYMSFIFAGSICTTIAVIRTISDQSIDKWLCAWFILSIILLEKPRLTWKFSLLIGFSLGMLIGTKYSGPLFFLALLPVYGRTLLRFFNIPRFLLTSFAITIVGLFWYIRNYFLEGNFLYPANLFFLKGVPGYTQQDWYLWKIPVEYPSGIIPILNAFLSEYMIWAFPPILILWFVIYSYRKREIVDKKISRVLFLVGSTGFVSLFLPITPPYKIDFFHIVSDMRYIYIFVVLLILATFLIMDKYKKNFLLASAALLNSIYVFSFIPYQPKIFVTITLVTIVLYFKHPRKLENIWYRIVKTK